MSKVELTLAISDYDHVADLTNGRVAPEGIALTCLNLSIEEIFFRFTLYREWDISEMSLAKYVSLISQGDTTLTAIPVFPSRVFRHSSIYVRSDGTVQGPADLPGRRVGVPEWAQTEGVYCRGLLQHQYGLDVRAIDWIQAGVREAGRAEKVALKLPDGIRISSVPDKTLSGMLVAGEIDAMISARPPEITDTQSSSVRRLFENFVEVETQYYRQTAIFPIMHVVALKRSVCERYPWVPMNLLQAFAEARRRGIERALEVRASPFPIPWCFERARQALALLGKDYWPYGIEPNRVTLDAFLLYAYEQGVCHRHLQAEELFAPQVARSFKV